MRIATQKRNRARGAFLWPAILTKDEQRFYLFLQPSAAEKTESE